MRDYGKISTSIWNSRKFRALPSDDARMLYFYLHTCPHVNSVGCFVLRDGYAAEDLGWDVERYRKGIEALSKADLIDFDDPERLVRIVNFLHFDPFTNINHAKGAVKLALALPECGVKLRLFHDIRASRFAEKMPEIARAIERLSKGYRTPEPEPEPYSVAKATGTDVPQASSDEKRARPKPQPTATAKPPDPVKVMFDAGIALLGSAGIAESRARTIIGGWRKDHGDAAVIEVIGRAQREGATEPVAFCNGAFRHAAKKATPEPGERRELPDGSCQSYDTFNGWIASHD